MFKIGNFSKLTRVSIRMLRHYDEIGLFKPAKIDDFTGYRHYSATQIKRLNLIISLRKMGFSLAEISVVTDKDTDKKLREMLTQKKDMVKFNIKLENDKLKRISSAIENLKKERVNMDYNVNIKSIPSYKVVSLRDKIPSYDSEGMLWQRLGEYIQEKGLNCSGVSYATYHDEGYKEGEVDVEVVMSTDKLLENENGFAFKKTESIEHAAYILVPGEFSNIAPAFNYLANWIEENGYQICGNSRELPIKGPWNESNPENYLNEIQIPVRKI
ncbi:MerR family transcriptional regulator [Mycoplasmatota bacterium zrk1]